MEQLIKKIINPQRNENVHERKLKEIFFIIIKIIII